MEKKLQLNKIYFMDNLDLLRKIESESIDLIYCDPPFGTGRDFFIDKNFVKIAYSDKFTLYELISYLRPRFKEFHRILKPTGFLYIHGNPRFIPYVRIELDLIFDIKNFRNEIVWCYKTAGRVSENCFAWNHDTILLYAKNRIAKIHPDLNDFPVSDKTLKRFSKCAKDGVVELEYNPSQIMKKRIYYLKNGIPIDWWEISIPVGGSHDLDHGKYPTQKPELLLERIIKASTNPKDIVFEPFLGGGTACVVAKRLDRKYIGVDISPSAIEFTNNRLNQTECQSRLDNLIKI
jgi:site-specific DNA-methyltransferase (adenine-specific)